MANITKEWRVGGYVPFIASGAVTANRLLVMDGADATAVPKAKKTAADSNPWLGVSDANVADTVAGELKIDGIVLLTLNATIAAGVELMMDATGGNEGKMIACTSGKQCCGILIEGGDAGNLRAVRLCRYIKP